jgi:hypothetical protein
MISEIITRDHTDLVGVAAECPDVPMYPIDGRPLVEKPRIGCAVFDYIIAREKAVSAQPILNGHENDALIRVSNKSWTTRICGVTGYVSTTMDPQKY